MQDVVVKIIAAQLREVGIIAEIENLEWAQWLEQVFKGKDFNLTIVSPHRADGYRHLRQSGILLPVRQR